MAWEEGKNNKEKSKTGQKASQRKQIRETNCMYCDSSRKNVRNTMNVRKQDFRAEILSEKETGKIGLRKIDNQNTTITKL